MYIGAVFDVMRERCDGGIHNIMLQSRYEPDDELERLFIFIIHTSSFMIGEHPWQ